jgi:hypothetical protein
MGFKKVDKTLTFADLTLKKTMDKNRCLTRLLDIADLYYHIARKWHFVP